jgi:transcriptional regulator with XRE-family HTH domain
MGRRATRNKSIQGAHLAALRKSAGLSQAALAKAVGVPQPSIAFWEFADRPPRSDILPALALALGVSVEEILTPGSKPSNSFSKPGPKGRLQKAFEAVSSLPKRQQEVLLQFIESAVSHRKVG